MSKLESLLVMEDRLVSQSGRVGGFLCVRPDWDRKALKCALEITRRSAEPAGDCERDKTVPGSIHSSLLSGAISSPESNRFRGALSHTGLGHL